jgi:restriction system protein
MVEVRHEGLKKVRLIRGTDQRDVEQQASILYASWEQIWKRRLADLSKHADPISRKQLAEHRTKEIRTGLEQIRNLLKTALDKPHTLIWNDLKDCSEFPVPMPGKGPRIEIPPEPKKYEDLYNPNLGFLDRFLSRRRYRKIQQAAQRFKQAHQEWEIKRKELLNHEMEIVRQYEENLKLWVNEKRRFIQRRDLNNAAVDHKREAFLKGIPEGVAAYFQIVLSRSVYPDWFAHSFSLEFDPGTKTLHILFRLPAPTDLPNIKEIHYDTIKNQLAEIYLTDAEQADLYETAICQLVLRTFYEVFDSDTITTIERIRFDGWIPAVDRSNSEREFIVNITVERSNFYALDLRSTEPRACFVQMGGILMLPASSKLDAVDSSAGSFN